MPSGGSARVAAGLVVLAAGIGVRLLRVRAEVPRAIGVFALTLAAVFAAPGTALTVLSPAAMQLIDAGGLVMLTAVVPAPMGAVAMPGRSLIDAFPVSLRSPRANEQDRSCGWAS
ncbi:MAG: hypothetical protein ACRDVL_05045 [Acidimicrobiia bacterium]